MINPRIRRYLRRSYLILVSPLVIVFCIGDILDQLWRENLETINRTWCQYRDLYWELWRQADEENDDD